MREILPADPGHRQRAPAGSFVFGPFAIIPLPGPVNEQQLARSRGRRLVQRFGSAAITELSHDFAMTGLTGLRNFAQEQPQEVQGRWRAGHIFGMQPVMDNAAIRRGSRYRSDLLGLTSDA